MQKAIKSKKVQPTIYVSNVDDIRLKVFPFEEMLYLNGEKKVSNYSSKVTQGQALLEADHDLFQNIGIRAYT